MPSEDKKLLELAAKAAGYQYAKHGGYIVVDGIPGNWNALTDDGDALRLAVQCGLEVSFVNEDGEDRACVGYPNSKGRIIYLFEDHCGDIFAATRRCIVRAAAAIGEAMP